MGRSPLSLIESKPVDKSKPHPDFFFAPEMENPDLPQRLVESCLRHLADLYYERVYLGTKDYDRYSKDVESKIQDLRHERGLVLLDLGMGCKVPFFICSGNLQLGLTSTRTKSIRSWLLTIVGNPGGAGYHRGKGVICFCCGQFKKINNKKRWACRYSA